MIWFLQYSSLFQVPEQQPRTGSKGLTRLRGLGLKASGFKVQGLGLKIQLA